MMTRIKNIRYFKVIGVFSLFFSTIITTAQSIDGKVIRFLSGQPAVEQETKAILNNSVAVLPFDNLSPNPDDAYFAVGVHQKILDQLAKIHDINVISSLSVVRYKSRYMPVAEIASELNVETIMKGSVRYADNRICIAVQIIDATNNNQLWSEEYERDLSDIFAVQAEIVEQITNALGIELSAAEIKRIDKVSTKSLQAYALYLKAKAIAANISPGISPIFYHYLDQAIAIDPNFALAHALKASSYGLSRKASYQLNELTLDNIERIALEHAEKALTLDPNLSYAYMAQGFIHQVNSREMEGRQVFMRANQLSPSDEYILAEYARFLTFFGMHDESVRIARQALVLGPFDIGSYAVLGWSLMHADDSSAAADIFRQAIVLSPKFHTMHAFLAMAEILSRNDAEALKHLRIAEQLEDYNITNRSLARLSYAYSMLGLKEDALRLVSQLERNITNGQTIRAGDRVLAYLAINEVDKAYDAMNNNPNEVILTSYEIKLNVLNDPILNEPRFVELRKRSGS